MSPYPTLAAFERAYAARSGLTVEQLHAYGMYGEPCDCGEDGCEGYAMRHPWEDAIVEDRMRGSRGQSARPSLVEFAERYLMPIQPYQREAIAALTEGVTDLRLPIVFGCVPWWRVEILSSEAPADIDPGIPIAFGRLEPGMIFYGVDAGNWPSVEVTITASRSGCSGSFERLDVPGLQTAARELEPLLSPGVSYEVHHINGDPTDNALENLRVVSRDWNPEEWINYFERAPDDHLARPRTRLPAEVEDSLSHELTDLARAGKADEFRALASTCVAPGEIDDLWEKLRRLIR